MTNTLSLNPTLNTSLTSPNALLPRAFNSGVESGQIKPQSWTTASRANYTGQYGDIYNLSGEKSHSENLTNGVTTQDREEYSLSGNGPGNTQSFAKMTRQEFNSVSNNANWLKPPSAPNFNNFFNSMSPSNDFFNLNSNPFEEMNDLLKNQWS